MRLEQQPRPTPLRTLAEWLAAARERGKLSEEGAAYLRGRQCPHHHMPVVMVDEGTGSEYCARCYAQAAQER